MAIGPGVESVGVLLWAADPDAARWQRSTWGGASWSSPAWQSVGCDVTAGDTKWGSSQEAGILSIAEASELDLSTYDPDRELDPLNSSSPYYGAVKPGTPIRLVGYAGAVGAIVNPSFELLPALTGWTPSAPALAEQSAIPDAADGAYTLRLFGDGVTVSPAVSQVIDVDPALSVTVTAQTRVAAGVEARMRVDALDAGGAVTGTVLGPLVSTASAFASIGGTFTVPPDTYRVRLHLYINGTPAAGLAVRFDAVTFAMAPLIAGTGYIDEISYDLASARGRIRAIGGIAYLAQAQLPAGVTLPNTLRARTRAVVAAVGLTAITPVEAEAPTDPDVDPAVAAYINTEARSAWQVISEAATDALWYVWADPTGVIRFRSWGAFVDAPISIGCPPGDADPEEVWLEGISTLETTASSDAVRNSVRAYSAGTTWQPARQDATSIRTYGPRPFDVPRVVPDFTTWADRILADRADAGLDIAVGEVRPYTEAELASLLATSLQGPSIIRVRDDAHGELVDIDVGMIGARIGVTPAGWRFGLSTLISRVAWEDITPAPPVIPPIPPPDPWHTETRTYYASSDALIALTSGGAKYGAGAANSLPFGTWSGWTYRALLAFPSIPWTKVRAVTAATLKVTTSTQVRIGFGSSPKSDVRRITSSWSAGSSSSPGSSNAVVWPGPNTTSSGAVTASLGTSQSVQKSINVLAIVRAWAPASAGGSGAAQYGIRLGEYSSSGSNTGEVWPVEQGGSARPQLELTLQVFD